MLYKSCGEGKELCCLVIVGISVNINKLEILGELSVPSYATLQSAGMDLMAEDLIVIKPTQRALIKTGIAWSQF
jgi:dUTPase